MDGPRGLTDGFSEELDKDGRPVNRARRPQPMPGHDGDGRPLPPIHPTVLTPQSPGMVPVSPPAPAWPTGRGGDPQGQTPPWNPQAAPHTTTPSQTPPWGLGPNSRTVPGQSAPYVPPVGGSGGPVDPKGLTTEVNTPGHRTVPASSRALTQLARQRGGRMY